MGLIERVKSMVTRNLTIREPDGWVAADRMSDAGEPVTEASTLGLSAVWACTNLVAGTIGTLPMMVYETSAGVRDVARTHPLYRILHDSPNYDQTAVDFWEFIAASLELWGNAYAAIERGANGRITALLPVRPDLVTVRRLASGALEYTWTEEGRRQVRTDPGMLHIRGFGGNPLGGMSTLHFGRQVFGVARAADRSAGAFFKNGMRPSGVLKFDKMLSPENRKIAREVLVAELSGSGNTGRPVILEGGLEWQSLSLNPEDAQMLETRKFSVEEICRMFGVPPHMVGHTENSTSWGTGLEQQTLAFQKFTLRRRLKRIEQAINKQLLSPADRARGVFVEFNLDGLLRGDTSSRFAAYSTGLQTGIYTINEVRALENMPPVPGGDVPRMQSQNVPITMADQMEGDE